MAIGPMRVLSLGRRPYAETESAMRAFTAARDAATEDEIWLVEHDPVYTQGLGGRPEHVLDPGPIPVVATNRGGQVTYHGPGQVVALFCQSLVKVCFTPILINCRVRLSRLCPPLKPERFLISTR